MIKLIQVDDKLNLILGNDIRVNDFLSLKQFKLKEISNIGFGEYLFRVSNILRDVEDFMKMFIDSPNYMDLYQKRNQLTALDMQLMVCTDDEYKKNIYKLTRVCSWLARRVYRGRIR